MTKNQLQLKIDSLKLSIKQSDDLTNSYTSELSALEKQLADLNKPRLTPLQFDELREAVEEAVGQFDFDDTDNYSYDFHIDYDNRIEIESLTFDNADEIVREVYNQVCELFAEIKEDDNQLNQD